MTHIRIDIRISSRAKRALLGGLLIASVGVVANANAGWSAANDPETWIAKQQPVSASKLLNLFTEADERLVALETGTETHAAGYAQLAGQSIPAGSLTKLVGYTKDYDTDDAFGPNTGDYTCPVDGLYRVSASAEFKGNLPQHGISLQLLKGGTSVAAMWQEFSADPDGYARPVGSATARCLKGEKLSVAIYHELGTGTTSGLKRFNYVTVEKIGSYPP